MRTTLLPILVFAAMLCLPETCRGAPPSPGVLERCSGTVSSIERDARIFNVIDDKGVAHKIRYDKKMTLFFRGWRMSEFDELKTGMKIEADYLVSREEEAPVCTWIEAADGQQ